MVNKSRFGVNEINFSDSQKIRNYIAEQNYIGKINVLKKLCLVRNDYIRSITIKPMEFFECHKRELRANEK